MSPRRIRKIHKFPRHPSTCRRAVEGVNEPSDDRGPIKGKILLAQA